MYYEVFYMNEGCFKGWVAPSRIAALILAAQAEYGVTPDMTEIVKGRFSYGFRDLAIKYKESEH